MKRSLLKPAAAIASIVSEYRGSSWCSQLYTVAPTGRNGVPSAWAKW